MMCIEQLNGLCLVCGWFQHATVYLFATACSSARLSVEESQLELFLLQFVPVVVVASHLSVGVLVACICSCGFLL